MKKEIFIHNFDPDEPFGGITFAIEYNQENEKSTDIIVGCAYCSQKDIYSKKKGREIALKRLAEFKEMRNTDKSKMAVFLQQPYGVSEDLYRISAFHFDPAIFFVIVATFNGVIVDIENIDMDNIADVNIDMLSKNKFLEALIDYCRYLIIIKHTEIAKQLTTKRLEQ